MPAVKLGVVIPARDEEASIGPVVARCRAEAAKWGDFRIVVSDNGSVDGTAGAARSAGAEVVHARRRGYGEACLKATRHLGDWPDILVFLDADGSSRPEELGTLLHPLLEMDVDLVLGRRPAGAPMTLPQRLGTGLAVKWMRWRWKAPFQDMGPFRAIRRKSLQALPMRDRTWGWTVEMQILALLHGLRSMEVPVSWQERLFGRSKISGTLGGVLRASARILWVLTRYSLRRQPASQEYPPTPLRG